MSWTAQLHVVRVEGLLSEWLENLELLFLLRTQSAAFNRQTSLVDHELAIPGGKKYRPAELKNKA